MRRRLKSSQNRALLKNKVKNDDHRGNQMSVLTYTRTSIKELFERAISANKPVLLVKGKTFYLAVEDRENAEVLKAFPESNHSNMNFDISLKRAETTMIKEPAWVCEFDQTYMRRTLEDRQWNKFTVRPTERFVEYLTVNY